MLMLICFFFFFQAEDGIRDWSVTGVQTCALPILGRRCGRRWRPWAGRRGGRMRRGQGWDWQRDGCHRRRASTRSEERRVGKEGRCGWTGEDDNKNDYYIE